MPQPISLADLVAISTPEQNLAVELAYAYQLGLATTSWEPLDPTRTILQTNAYLASDYSAVVNLIAQGGYASYAAAMVDANGLPITTWMDLLTPNLYNTVRFLATFATGQVPVSNSSATNYPYSPNNPLHFQYPTSGGATYTSVGTGVISASTSGQVLVIADAAYPGSLGNAAAGTILQLTTPLAGVTIQALLVPFIGTPQETNQALLLRSTNKLGTLSVTLNQIQQGSTPVPSNPDPTSAAYDYVAQSIAVGTPSSSWPFYVSAKVSRSQTFGNVGSGVVEMYLANSSGPSTTGDVAVIQAAVQALCVGQCITPIVNPATGINVTISYTIYYTRGLGYTQTQATTAIFNALALYFASVPVGGVPILGTNGILPFAAVEDVIYDALPGAIDLYMTLNGNSVDLQIGTGAVPILLAPQAVVIIQ